MNHTFLYKIIGLIKEKKVLTNDERMPYGRAMQFVFCECGRYWLNYFMIILIYKTVSTWCSWVSDNPIGVIELLDTKVLVLPVRWEKIWIIILHLKESFDTA